MANESDLEPSDEEGEIEGQGQSRAPRHPQDMQKWVQCARCNCWRKVLPIVLLPFSLPKLHFI